MKTFAEKISEARRLRRLTQPQLAELVGLSKRAVVAYETGESRPRAAMLLKLAEALQISPEYLKHDDIQDPTYCLEHKPYVEQARERFGAKAAQEIDFLMTRNTALFAGGDISDDAKEAYFEAVMQAYFACKKEARKTYGSGE